MQDPRPGVGSFKQGNFSQPLSTAPVQPVEIVIPPKPVLDPDLAHDIDEAIRFLASMADSPRLNSDLRIAMNDIKNTIKTLKTTVVRMTEEAQAGHDKLVEVVRSQRLIGS
jgi:hypothetical protein